MSDNVKVSMGANGVLEIVFNRPQDGNALSPEMVTATSEALAAMAPETKAVLMRGEGKDFCAGRIGGMPQAGRFTAQDLRKMVADPVLDFYAALRHIPVPLIASVRGRAHGVGCALAGLADIAIAADTAVFSIPEMNRDIAPTLVMTALADRIPRAALARLVMTRDEISAAEAKSLAIVGIVVPEAKLDAEVQRVLDGFAKNTIPVLRGVKSYLNAAPEMSFAVRRQHAALINGEVTAERYR
jgi:enoyl-CoA hydratase/carnithine racemase